MSPRKPRDYSVGYGKPPAETRFRKGRSGNPAGRPKGRAELSTILQRALATKVTVTEHGRRTEKSKLEITLTQLVNKATSGDLKATRLLFDLFPLLHPDGATAAGFPDLAADRAVAERLIARLVENTLSPTSPEDSDASD